MARDKGLDPILDKLTAEPRHITEERAAEVERLIARPLENDPFLDFELPPEMTEEIKKQVAGELEAAGMPAEQARTQADLLTRLLAKPLAAMGVKDIGRWFQERLQTVRKQAGNAEGEGGQVLHQPLRQDVFGEEFAGFRGQPEAAIEHLIREKRGYVPGAFYREELGNIDLAWGKDGAKGYGLAHIIERRTKEGYDGESFARSLPKMIREGKIEQRPDFPGRAYIVHENSESVIRLDWNGQERKWLVTAYPLKQKGGLSSSGRGSRDTRTQVDETAPPSNSKGHINSIDELFEKDKSLFQSTPDPAGPRGMLETLADGTFRMTLFEGAADASTPVHESAHLFVEVMREVLATSPEHVSDWIAFEGAHNEFVRLAEWAGQKDLYGQWSTEAHEKLARGFEAYLMEGKAPAEGLRGIFAKMKDWLLGIYKDTRKLNVELTDEVREVFDRLLATDEEVFLEATRLDEPKGLSPEIRAELAPEYAAARAAQEEAIRKKRMAEAKKMKGQWAKEGQAEADNHPHQRMLDDIINEGGIKAQSLRAGGFGGYIQALNRKRPGKNPLVSENSRVGYDEFAERYGMDGDDFIKSLVEGPTKKDLVKQYMDSQEAKWAEYFAEDAPISDAEIKLRILELEAAKREKQSAAEAAKALRDVRKQLEKPGGLSRYKSAILKRTGLRPVSEAEAMNMRDLKLSLAAEERGAREGRGVRLSLPESIPTIHPQFQSSLKQTATRGRSCLITPLISDSRESGSPCPSFPMVKRPG